MTALHVALELAATALVFFTLPLALDLLGLSVAALLPPRKPRTVHGPYNLAVVIPAHNEQLLIAACVHSIQGAASIYVVAHNCTDQTAARAAEAGATVLPLDGEGGKGIALDHGFAHALAAGADGVLVLDADSIAGSGLVSAISARLAAGAAALQCRYQVANAAASTRTRVTALGFLGINVVRPRGRDRLGLSCGIFGNGFALAASTLRAVPYTANSLVEDLEYHLNLIQAGLRVEFVDEAAVFGEMPEGSAAAPSQRARWEGGRMLMRRAWSGPLVREILRGRLVLLEPLLDLRAFPLSSEVMMLAAALVLGIAAHLTWLTAYSTAGLAVLVLYILAAARVGSDPLGSLRALASVPGYLAWKLWMIPRTRLAARRDAAWVRTARNPQGESPKE